MNATANGLVPPRPRRATAPVIEIRGLVKTFGSPGGAVRAVDGLDLPSPRPEPVYIAVKIAVAMVLGLLSVTVVFAVGVALGARLQASAWLGCFLIAWLGSLVFAAFGLFMGYLLPSENVMQLLGPARALLSFAGGLFMPLHGWFDTASKVFPTNGVAVPARAPFAEPSGGAVALAIVNVLAWAAVFTIGSAVLFRRDTAR
ncbi:ABC transporter permease [Nocardia sp. NPDC088792]|uniref:ABC transporter permease n=1 Tax=Nocardia sp. NPDC088792 TaxID=3364332 RepID=UPI003800B856